MSFVVTHLRLWHSWQVKQHFQILDEITLLVLLTLYMEFVIWKFVIYESLSFFYHSIYLSFHTLFSFQYPNIGLHISAVCEVVCVGHARNILSDVWDLQFNTDSERESSKLSGITHQKYHSLVCHRLARGEWFFWNVDTFFLPRAGHCFLEVQYPYKHSLAHIHTHIYSFNNL